MSGLSLFLAEYDSGGLMFDGLRYRSGAHTTQPFGLAEGYKVRADGTLEWGHVRIHTGVDRAGGKRGDQVIAPFTFHTSNLIDYEGRGYGSLVLLDQLEYRFQMRIAHMHPTEDLADGMWKKLMDCDRVKAGTVLGRAGCYGVGEGAHTHTEIVSLEETNEIFDEILDRRYGEDSYRDYTQQEITEEYRHHTHTVVLSDIEMLADFAGLKADRRMRYGNRFRYRYWDGILNREATRYSSALLFNGL